MPRPARLALLAAALLLLAPRAARADDAEDALPVGVRVEVYAAGLGHGAKALLGEGSMHGAFPLEGDAAARFDGDREAGASAVELLGEATLLAPSGEEASIEDLASRSYVPRHALRRAAGGTLVADPEVATFETGLRVRLVPWRLAHGGVVLFGRAEHVRLDTPLVSRTVPLPTGGAVEVQSAAITTTAIDVAVTLAPGSRALVTGLGATEDGRELLLLLAPAEASEAVPYAAAPATDVGSLLVSVETWVLEVDAAATAAAGIHEDGVLLLEDAAADRLVSAATGRAGTVVASPRLLVEAGGRASVSVTTELAYVKDYEVHEQADGSRVADPVVATMDEGLVVELALGTPVGGALPIALAATWTEVGRPIPEIEVQVAGHPMPGEHPLKIQVPELTTRRVRGPIALDALHTACYAGLGRGEHGLRLLLVRARPVRGSGAAGSDR